MKIPHQKDIQSEKEKQEEMLRQVQRIHRLAIRLPWIVLGVSLLAFIIIFIQIYLTH